MEDTERRRPVVKRTYSRISKPENTDDIEKENTIELNENISQSKELPSSIKKTKITDFFMKKVATPGQDTSFELSPLHKLKISSSPRSPHESPLISKKQNQTFLDLGQKDLVSTQCSECLMHYNKSFPEDQALHRRFHSQYLKGFRYNPSDEVAQEIAPTNDKLDIWKRYRFFQGTDQLLRKLDPFLRFVSIQLGAEPLEFIEMKGNHCLLIAIDSVSHEIAACALFEPIKRAYITRRECLNVNIELEPLEIPASFGVSRVWTSEKHRKRGLATLLLELKSTNRALIAFSQPTPSGFAFAQAFQAPLFGGTQCLVYLNSR